MSYSVYLNEKRIYHDISEEEALRRQTMFRQMIHAGVKELLLTRTGDNYMILLQ